MRPAAPAASRPTTRRRKERDADNDADDRVLDQIASVAHHHVATAAGRVAIADPIDPARPMLLVDVIRRFWMS